MCCLIVEYSELCAHGARSRGHPNIFLELLRMLFVSMRVRDVAGGCDRENRNGM